MPAYADRDSSRFDPFRGIFERHAARRHQRSVRQRSFHSFHERGAENLSGKRLHNLRAAFHRRHHFGDRASAGNMCHLIAIAKPGGLRIERGADHKVRTGKNRDACRLAGVRVWRLLFIDYVICALLASIAGFVLVGHTNSADLSLASTYLLPSIAAVIIGGTSIFGGSGGYSGTIIGALILTVLDGLLTLLDSPEPIKQILYGAIIFVLAAAYSRLTA